jgi:hypothetical protein
VISELVGECWHVKGINYSRNNCKYPIRFHYLEIYIYALGHSLEWMSKGECWWDLIKDNKLEPISNLRKALDLYHAFPSIEWFTQVPRSILTCWPKSRSLSSAEVIESWKLRKHPFLGRLWFVGQSQGHFCLWLWIT